MKKFLVAALSISVYFPASAQFAKVNIEATDNLVKEESGIQGQPLLGTFLGFSNPPSMDEVWQPILYKVSDNESDDNELTERIKEEKERLKANYVPVPGGAKTTTTVTVTPPSVGANFQGPNNSGIYTPLDNSIAISDKDTIVAFVNSMIAYYSASGTYLYGHDIWGMLGDATITNSLCDPKVIWDNVARRFIFYVQVCDKVAANSYVVLGFSKTSNPRDGWYHYKFTGNPLNNGCFFDYPKMAVSNDEVFVTGNLFSASSGGYSTSCIYQIQKAPCLSGSTLTTANSKFYTTNRFTPLPVGYGQKGSYGPGIYLVSTGGTTGGSTSFKLLNITNNIASGSAVLNTYNVTTSNFSTAGNANQLGSTWKLDVLDCRSMDGFYLKGIIHFVYSKDVGSGYSGTVYNRLKVSTLADSIAVFSNATGTAPTDITYPAIASPGVDSNDRTVIMSFNESGTSIYPRTCVVKCDQGMNWSAPVVVKAGSTFVNYSGSTGTYQRWGDYNGMCKRYGDSGVVWMAGMYGSTGNIWQQWIAQIKGHLVDVPEVVKSEAVKATVYPNPVTDYCNIKFNVPERQQLVINITDMEGRTVVELYHGIAEAGENVFSFRKASMANGVYSVNIIGEKTNIRNEKIVITGK